MTLNELKSNIDFALEHGCSGDEPVLITLAAPSVGARASAKVASANMGFDWEHGQFRIEPEVNLRADGRTLEEPLWTVAYQYIYEGEKRKTIVHHCPTCGAIVKKDHRYCPQCGQRIIISKFVRFVHDYRKDNRASR